MAKLSTHIRSELRYFAFVLANGTVDRELLDIDLVDYSRVLLDASGLETIFAIYLNNVELDDTGRVVNPQHAKRRAAQYIRSCIDAAYVVEPPFEPWEVELH